ncbi:MAG: tetratricopeptide repeat protein [Sphingobium sp.]|nr:tetratricopeptide repeat protein [Sphingobium sp.]MBP6112081.1 tetratricopeptide repeat protein [Sphingobium sp.]MBP8671088.1 tetratricopeptide repeat protein [Sphingobium sp.]MBP9156801.1 tetratricopeptide repeat protein [Sphingobium sp.]MCC6481503.1 tetratricopeptide repeat protein [Sphingomonadaceae bacterium]
MISARRTVSSLAPLFLLIAASLLFAAPQAVAGPREDARAGLARALAALGNDDPRTARIELMNAIKADPALAEARIVQARVLLMLGNGRGAQDELKRATQLGAPLGPLRHLRAHAALLLGDPETAIKEAAAPDADARETLFRTRIEAQALQALGRYAESAQAFDRALALAPRDSALWADIARYRIATGDMAAALAASDRALALAPASVDALTLKGVLARDQYGLAESLRWFDAALKRNRDYVPALTEYAASLLDMGQASRALALSRRALLIAPGLPRACFLQALLAARAGNYMLARSLLARTHGALDGQAATRLLRGVLQMQGGNPTLAIAELKPLLDAQPLNMRARLLLARAYAADGQYQDAESTLFPIVERADAGTYALSLAAHIHDALGNAAVATRFRARAVAMAPGPSLVYRGAGTIAETAPSANAGPRLAAPNLRYMRALLEAGQVEAALARARALQAANPGAPAAALALGDCLIAAGKPAEAAAAYEAAGNLRYDEDVALRLMDAWRRAGKRDRAEYALRLLLWQNPMSMAGQRLAASYWLAAEDYPRALALLEGLSARLGNEDALLMANLAHAHIGMGDAQAALPYAVHAYRLLPASAVTSDALGWALLMAAPEDKRAVELLEKALTLAPAEPLVQWHLGEAYAATGDSSRAEALLRAAAAAPGFARAAQAAEALRAL